MQALGNEGPRPLILILGQSEPGLEKQAAPAPQMVSHPPLLMSPSSFRLMKLGTPWLSQSVRTVESYRRWLRKSWRKWRRPRSASPYWSMYGALAKEPDSRCR